MKKGQKKRSLQVILYQRRTIAKNYLKGFSQDKIGKLVNLSQVQVGKEIETLRAEWVQSADIDFSEAQGAALHKIDDMEQEAIREYIKSRKVKTIKTIKKEPFQIPDPAAPQTVDDQGNITSPMITEFRVTEQTIKKENGTGDVRWHDQILKCIDMRLKVLGLYKQVRKGEQVDEGFISTDLSKETTKSKTALFFALFEEWESNIREDSKVLPER